MDDRIKIIPFKELRGSRQIRYMPMVFDEEDWWGLIENGQPVISSDETGSSSAYIPGNAGCRRTRPGPSGVYPQGTGQ